MSTYARTMPASGRHAQALWELDKSAGGERTMSRDALAVSLAALLFLAMVGGVLFYKGPTDTLRRLGDVEALLQGGSSTPPPATTPPTLEVAMGSSASSEGPKEKGHPSTTNSDGYLAAAPATHPLDHAATDVRAPWFESASTETEPNDGEDAFQPRLVEEESSGRVVASDLTAPPDMSEEMTDDGPSVPPALPAAITNTIKPESEVTDSLEKGDALPEAVGPAKEGLPAESVALAALDPSKGSEDKLDLPDLEPPPPVTPRRVIDDPVARTDEEQSSPAAEVPSVMTQGGEEETPSPRPIAEPASFSNPPGQGKVEPSVTASPLALPPPPPLATVPTRKQPQWMANRVEPISNNPRTQSVESETADGPTTRIDPAYMPRAETPVEPERKQVLPDRTAATLQRPTEDEDYSAPSASPAEERRAQRNSVDAPRKVIPSPTSYGSSPYSVAWPSNRAANTAPASSIARSAMPDGTGVAEAQSPNTGAAIETNRAIATTKRSPAEPSVQRAPEVAAPLVTGVESRGVSNQVIATAVPLAQGTRAEALPLTTPGAARSADPGMEPIASTRAKLAETVDPAQEVTSLAPDAKPREAFILVQGLPASLATGFTKSNVAESAEPRPENTSKARVVSYDVDTYIVLPGDSFNSIARSMYKNPAYGPALARYNRSKSPSNATLNSGGRILMPPADVLESELNRMNRASPAVPRRDDMPSVSEAVARSSESQTLRESKPISPFVETPSPGVPSEPVVAASEPPARPSHPISAETNKPTNLAGIPIYTVQKQETLYAIARRTLGDGRRWREIYELNTDRLESEYDVPIGISLKLPKDALRR